METFEKHGRLSPGSSIGGYRETEISIAMSIGPNAINQMVQQNACSKLEMKCYTNNKIILHVKFNFCAKDRIYFHFLKFVLIDTIFCKSQITTEHC